MGFLNTGVTTRRNLCQRESVLKNTQLNTLKVLTLVEMLLAILDAFRSYLNMLRV